MWSKSGEFFRRMGWMLWNVLQEEEVKLLHYPKDIAFAASEADHQILRRVLEEAQRYRNSDKPPPQFIMWFAQTCRHYADLVRQDARVFPRLWRAEKDISALLGTEERLSEDEYEKTIEQDPELRNADRLSEAVRNFLRILQMGIGSERKILV